MEILKSWLDINYVVWQIGDYPLSLIELLGTLSGILSVYLATRGNILTWATGISNEIAFFILFYQVQLYSDMLLQVYFFVISAYGWVYWNKTKDTSKPVATHQVSWPLIGLILIAGTVGLGLLMQQIHILLPSFFPLAAEFPFADAFTTTASILATILLARKQIENWILWIAVDLISIVLYFYRDIWFISFEYVLFLVLATYGYFSWKKQKI